MSDKSLRLPESLYNVPPKFTLSEFRVYVFPVLASLASYHAYLEPYLQQNLIKCLEVKRIFYIVIQIVTSYFWIIMHKDFLKSFYIIIFGVIKNLIDF